MPDIATSASRSALQIRSNLAASVNEMLETSREVMNEFPGAILCPDPIQGKSGEETSAYLSTLLEAGVLGLAGTNPGRQNSLQLDESGLPFGRNEVRSTFDDANLVLGLACRWKTPLTIGIYEPYNLRWVIAYAAAGKLPPGSMVKLYFGGRFSLVNIGKRAVNFGLPPTTEAVDAYVSMIEGLDLNWSVSVMGDSVLDTPIARHALERGGHLRVGIEDAAGTSEATNREMVEASVELARKVGRPVAGARNARAALLPSA